MIEIMIYLWLTIWQPIVFDLPHGKVDGQSMAAMAHNSVNFSATKSNSNK